MLSFSHASSTKDLPGWYLLSRYQSCRCAFDSFRKGSGLHSFRTCAGRSPEQSGTADLCVHRDAQSLAFCCQVAINGPRYLFLVWTVGKGVGSRVVDAVGALQSKFVGPTRIRCLDKNKVPVDKNKVPGAKNEIEAEKTELKRRMSGDLSLIHI